MGEATELLLRSSDRPKKRYQALQLWGTMCMAERNVTYSKASDQEACGRMMRLAVRTEVLGVLSGNEPETMIGLRNARMARDRIVADGYVTMGSYLASLDSLSSASRAILERSMKQGDSNVLWGLLMLDVRVIGSNGGTTTCGDWCGELRNRRYNLSS